MIKEKLKFAKSTPGTHVYKATQDEPAVPSLYIKKGQLPDKPDFIEIEIKGLVSLEDN